MVISWGWGLEDEAPSSAGGGGMWRAAALAQPLSNYPRLGSWWIGCSKGDKRITYSKWSIGLTLGLLVSLGLFCLRAEGEVFI